MALATHALQGSHCLFPSEPSLWSSGTRSKSFVPTYLGYGRKDKSVSLKCKSRLSVGAPLVLGLKMKTFKVSAFKGSGRHDESGSRASSSKSLKNPVQVSYIQHESEESSVQQVPVSYTEDGTSTMSVAVRNLFRNWLMLLRTPPQKQQPIDEVVEEPGSTESSETENAVQRLERGSVLKAVWCFFLGLDSIIMIPLLVFLPLYLGVTLRYGREVSRELMPLWFIGPLIVALYVKMFKGICRLYVFSFKQTVKVIKNLPSYSLATYRYIAHGKLKEDIRARLWQPVVDIKNMDYKETARRKMIDLGVWLYEKYLDYVESIWPYYCRTIRFLKRANLI